MNSYFINNGKHLICFFCFIVFINICFAQTHLANKKTPHKINGISFLGPPTPHLTVQMVEQVKLGHANWISIIPETKLNRYTLQLMSDAENTHWASSFQGSIQTIRYAQKVGLKIMLKPHIVLSKSIQEISKSRFIHYKKNRFPLDKTGKACWRGDFYVQNKHDWELWEKEYEKYILAYAQLADSLQVEVFCIGTEFKECATRKPKFWRQLIQKVRKHYTGKITYAANWDEYANISFWDDLDFIGINAYFPISNAKVPKVQAVLKNWRIHIKNIQKVHKQFHRPVLITEFGYRNREYAGKEPWLFDFGYDQLNNQAQVNLYEAFFQVFWRQNWVIGGFLWHWDYEPQPLNNTDFSPQGKPALQVLRKWYDQNHFD